MSIISTKNFKYFYDYLGIRIFIGLFFSILVGLLDGVGLTMFIPLLQMVDGDYNSTSDNMGNLQVIIQSLENFGLEINLNTVLIFILFIFILKGVVKFIEGYYNVQTQQIFILKIRKQCVNYISNLKYKEFIKTDSGRIQNTLSGEVRRVVIAYQNYFLTIQNGVFVAVYVFLAILSNPQFAILVAIGGGLSSLIFTRIYRYTKSVSSKLTNHSHRYQGLLIQAIHFFKYFKATNRMDEYSEKLRKEMHHIEDNNKIVGMIQATLGAVREPLILSIVVAVIYIEVTFLNQKLSLIILSLLFFYRALNYIMMIQNTWNQFLSNSGSMENMIDFLSVLDQHQEEYASTKYTSFKTAIELNNLNFTFNEKNKVLTNINLTIEKNKTIAFVGESGSGKTTLINIISGLLIPSSGKILIDNKPITEIDIRTFQNKIGYITQDPVVFNDTVFNNVTFWAEKTPENISKFWEALKKAAIDEFVIELEHKEDTQMGNNGVMISGGQKQRISIARELYKDIDLLILDEATSALDSETEKTIQENIDLLKGKYTILIVAHRLSSIKKSDSIVHLDKGVIKSQGTFEELINTNERFKKMVNLQKL